jgi:hypothetical protein
MIRIFMLIFLITLSFNTYARQSGGGSGDDLKGVCELAGGSWHGSESSGSWACCWADWGCYGCINKICKMTCRTDRCRKANAMSSRVNKNDTRVKGLAPAGMKAPVVPKLQMHQ